jgi:hypothetical protein
MKTFKTILVASVLFFGFLLISFYNNHYNREAIITEIKGNLITFTDAAKNEWIFESSNAAAAFSVFDKVRLLMFNNNTEEYIFDDEIIKIVKMN